MSGSNLEDERNRLMALNELKAREFGLSEAIKATQRAATAKSQQQKVAAAAAAPPPRPPRQPSQPQNDEQAPRRSGRARREVNYNEDAAFQQAKDGAAARPSKRQHINTLTPEEAEELRQRCEEQKRARAAAKGDGGSKGPRGPRDSGKGVRIVGGKVYDSANGITCHWCRHKTNTFSVQCTLSNCGGEDAMPKSFCVNCLRNRNGEDAYAAHESGDWVCPCCRVSCGRGCVSCCNCGPCRKKLDLEPTGQIMSKVREAGFDNAHDYLINQITGETQEQLKKRKLSQPWADRIRQEQQELQAQAAAAGAGKEEENGEEENEQQAATAQQVEVTSDGTDDEAEAGEGKDAGKTADKVGGEHAPAAAAGGRRGGGGGRSRGARKAATAAPGAAGGEEKPMKSKEVAGQGVAQVRPGRGKGGRAAQQEVEDGGKGKPQRA